jgi:hypothetical protein
MGFPACSNWTFSFFLFSISVSFVALRDLTTEGMAVGARIASGRHTDRGRVLDHVEDIHQSGSILSTDPNILDIILSVAGSRVGSASVLADFLLSGSTREFLDDEVATSLPALRIVCTSRVVSHGALVHLPHEQEL